jgi:hypothetical protein
MLTHPMQPDAYWHLTIRVALPWLPLNRFVSGHHLYVCCDAQDTERPDPTLAIHCHRNRRHALIDPGD